MTSFVSQISLCILFIVGSFNNLTGQLKGKISDADGQPLAYATIYLESTSYGTITNAEGEYSLDMPAKGTYKVIYQYVGYKTASRSIDYDKQPIIIDIILKNDENIISELVITADREDPAYA
ncbi:MAG: carboxypeptidase-like regulatory domain-containing protein, partial [Saprospiraceae bacterium]